MRRGCFSTEQDEQHCQQAQGAANQPEPRCVPGEEQRAQGWPQDQAGAPAQPPDSLVTTAQVGRGQIRNVGSRDGRVYYFTKRPDADYQDQEQEGKADTLSKKLAREGEKNRCM